MLIMGQFAQSILIPVVSVHRRAGSIFKQGGEGQKSSFYHVTRYVDFDPFPLKLRWLLVQ